MPNTIKDVSIISQDDEWVKDHLKNRGLWNHFITGGNQVKRKFVPGDSKHMQWIFAPYRREDEATATELYVYEAILSYPSLADTGYTCYKISFEPGNLGLALQEFEASAVALTGLKQ